MDTIGVLLVLLGFCGFVVFLIMFFVMMVKKKPKKNSGISMACCFAAFAIGLILIGASDPGTSSKPSKNIGKASKYDSEYTEKDSSTVSSKNTGKQEGSGELGNYFVEINESAKIKKNRDGEPVIIISFDWTNNSDETTSAMVSFGEQAFQDGIELESSFQSSLYESDNYSREIRPGTTITVERAFELNNETSVVEFEVSNWLSWNDESIVYRNFNIE